MPGRTDGLARIRLVIADDQAMIRTGLRFVAESAADIEVVGEAVDGLEALSVTRRLRPDVLLMDIAMPRLDGLGAARRLLSDPHPPRIVMLTTFDTDENLHASLRAGVNGFLLKTSPPEQLIEAVRVAAAGDALIDPAAAMRVIASFTAHHRPVAPPELATLTSRELEVLRLLARGLSNPEIARRLQVGDATIRTHVARVLHKLGLRDRIQAVVFAYEAGVVRPGQRDRSC
ncbi:response regulator [Streptosporangium amethystogenes subsp. fukuiense]|uniref:Response regulator n=1 Tax=Streptosporangium amethystogenes subsp. fukuiense TaxID=698418 RepID=A0ABW2T0T6_9ACTN